MLLPFGVLVASDVVIFIKRLATGTITLPQMRRQMLVPDLDIFTLEFLTFKKRLKHEKNHFFLCNFSVQMLRCFQFFQFFSTKS